MNRRDFINSFSWSVLVPSMIPNLVKGHFPPCEARLIPVYLDEMDSNWFAFREKLMQIANDGYEIRNYCLYAEAGGFRQVELEARDAWKSQMHTIRWSQPWSPDVS